MANSELPGDLFSDLMFALPFVDTWADTGLPAIRYFKLQASCGQHGTFWETWDRDPGPSDTYLICLHCSFAGVTRKCPVRTVLVCGEGVIPE